MKINIVGSRTAVRMGLKYKIKEEFVVFGEINRKNTVTKVNQATINLVVGIIELSNSL